MPGKTPAAEIDRDQDGKDQAVEQERDDGLDPDTDEGGTDDLEAQDAGDEPEGDDDDAGEDGQKSEPVEVEGQRPVSRGERDYGRLRAERRAAEERAAKAERELEAARRVTQGPSVQDQINARAEKRQRELETARLEGGAESAMEVRFRHMQEDLQASAAQANIVSADTADRANFDALVRSQPALEAFRDQVEQRLADFRRQGANPQREYIAKVLFAESVLSRGARARNKQTRNGDAARARETSRPGSGNRSNVARENQRGGSDQERRFNRIKDISI